MPLPKSYNISLPAVKLSHHPPSSPAPTPIIIVTLNRPEAKNAFNRDMIDSLEEAFTLLSHDPRVKCIILTGSDPSNKIFCAGMDLASTDNSDGTSPKPNPEQQQSSSSRPPPPPDSPPATTRATHRDGGGRVALAIHRCGKPVIAALNGSAVGVGITVTLPCAIRVASRDARVGFVFARRGLVMEACSSFFLPRLVGASRALHLVTTGAAYPAASPLLGGLFAELAAPGEVLARAVELAEDVAANCSAVSTVVMRDMVYRGGRSPEEAHLLESRLLFDMFAGRDYEEGISSFLQKRKPEMKGSMQHDAPSTYPWWEDSLKKGVAKL